jgi:hypothetical protein
VQVFFHPVLLLFAVVLLLFAFLRFQATCKIKKQNRRGWKCLKEGAWSLYSVVSRQTENKE